MTSKASEQELGNVKTVQIGREVTEVASIPGDEVDILLNYTYMYYHGKVQHSPENAIPMGHNLYNGRGGGEIQNWSEKWAAIFCDPPNYMGT